MNLIPEIFSKSDIDMFNYIDMMELVIRFLTEMGERETVTELKKYTSPPKKMSCAYLAVKTLKKFDMHTTASCILTPA